MQNNDRLYGLPTHPYYLFVPRWIESSAGIRGLHYLCHALNVSGHKAYLVFSEKQQGDTPRINPILNTPVLTEEIVEAHFKAGLTPIVIYSETVPGNPLGSTAVVRYLLNYIGALGGDSNFGEDEMIVSYSENIAENYSQAIGKKVAMILFLPPVDPREFKYVEEKGNYQIVYAGKYRSFIGVPPKVGTLKSYEIFRDGPKMQSRETVIKLLSSASAVYCFENSSIATEAILSGTPVCFVENEFLGKIIAEKELSSLGTFREESLASIEEARRNTLKAREVYLQQVENFSNQLSVFIDATQMFAHSVGYQYKVTIPNVNYSIGTVSKHRIRMAIKLLKNKGLVALVRSTYHVISRDFYLRRR